MRNRKWWMKKPLRNQPGIVPKRAGRRIVVDLLPRVQQLVSGDVIGRPVWLDAALAHPPPSAHKRKSERPLQLSWSEEDRLRRVWQRRNPEASMHPKVLFLDERSLPEGTQVDHPADVFVREQMRLMRRGLGEDEAYRRVLLRDQQRDSVRVAEVDAARAAAAALGATPAADAHPAGGAAGSMTSSEGRWLGSGLGSRLSLGLGPGCRV